MNVCLLLEIDLIFPHIAVWGFCFSLCTRRIRVRVRVRPPRRHLSPLTHHSTTHHTTCHSHLVTQHSSLHHLSHLTHHTTTHHSSTSHTSLITPQLITSQLITAPCWHLYFHVLPVQTQEIQDPWAMDP